MESTLAVEEVVDDIAKAFVEEAERLTLGLCAAYCSSSVDLRAVLTKMKHAE